MASTIPIGTGTFLLESPAIGDRQLRIHARRLFHELDRRADELLALNDYALHLEVEQGSVKGRAAILVALSALYGGIAKYPDFIHGVELIGKHAKQAVDEITRVVPSMFKRPESALKEKRTDAGRISELTRVFNAVARGELSAEDATARAKKLFEVEGQAPLGFYEDLADAVRSIKLDPKQMTLLPPDVAPMPEQQRTPRAPRGGPDDLAIVDTRGLRIELHREHKGGKMRVKVTPVRKSKRLRLHLKPYRAE